jgi:hypothetical protein
MPESDVRVRPSHRSWRALRRWVLVIGLLIGLVTGCGDPTTQVYVSSSDDAPYIVRLVIEEETTEDRFVPPTGNGLIYDYRGDVRGQVQLLDTDCAVIATVAFEPGRTLLSVSNGRVSATPGADLSNVPAAFLEPVSDCIGA